MFCRLRFCSQFLQDTRGHQGCGFWWGQTSVNKTQSSARLPVTRLSRPSLRFVPYRAMVSIHSFPIGGWPCPKTGPPHWVATFESDIDVDNGPQHQVPSETPAAAFPHRLGAVSVSVTSKMRSNRAMGSTQHFHGKQAIGRLFSVQNFGILQCMHIQADTSHTDGLPARIQIWEDRNLEIQPRSCFSIPRNGRNHCRGVGPSHALVVIG